MSEQREMTLDEWVDRLPVNHSARRELQALRAQTIDRPARTFATYDPNKPLTRKELFADDPPTPPTLAARLSELNTTQRLNAWRELGEEMRRICDSMTRDQREDLLPDWFTPRLNAMLVAALTPEPVMPIESAVESRIAEEPGRCRPAADGALGVHVYPDTALHSACYCGAARLTVTHTPTPEPVTPPVAAPVKKRPCTCLGTCRGADGLAPGYQCAFDDYEHDAKPTAPVTAPADDPRGLAVTFLDVDGLQHIAATMGESPRALWLRELADRLATQITETLSLRQSLRQAEQERDALRAALREVATDIAQAQKLLGELEAQ